MEKIFIRADPVTKELSNGIYSLKYSQEYGVYISLVEEKTDKPLDILEESYKVIKKDFDKFISLEEKYKENGFEFNRAILLYGEPNCGKKYISRKISEGFDGITIYFEDPVEVLKIVSLIKMNDVNKKILLISDDIALMSEKYGVIAVTNLFKSRDNSDGIYIICTTNYEDKISEYLSDRPGIFEEKFFVDYPNKLDREKYIKFIFSKFEIKVTSKKILKITNDTDGLSLGHIKNLIESSFFFDYDYEDKLEELKVMKENIQLTLYPENSADSGKGIGFGN